MRHLASALLLLAALSLSAGCVIMGDDCSISAMRPCLAEGAQSTDVTAETAAEEAESEPEREAGAGSGLVERSRLHKEAVNDGRDVIAELESPIDPIFKTRTYGELTQVSFTRVGGDDDVDVSRVEGLVAFCSDRHGPDHNIYVKNITGAVVTQKTFKPFDEIQPKFSPDGSRIAYASNKNGNYDIWIMDTHATGAAVQVTFGDEDDLHPAWSPDGNVLVYSSYSSRTGGWSLMETNVVTGEVRDLGPGKFPTISPDGKKILFQRARMRDGYWYSIWTMNRDGTEQTEIITSADWAAINPCWSPDGLYVAFATVNKSPESKLEDRIWEADDIYIIGVNGRGLLQLTADSQPDWEPCWSELDGRIYFVSERNGFRNIWSVKPPVYNVAASGPDPADTGN